VKTLHVILCVIVLLITDSSIEFRSDLLVSGVRFMTLDSNFDVDLIV